MSETPDPSEPELKRLHAWRPQFTLRFLFRAVFLASVAAALLGALLREGIAPESNAFLVVIWLAITAPLGVMIGLSLIEPAVDLWNRLRRGQR